VVPADGGAVVCGVVVLAVVVDWPVVVSGQPRNVYEVHFLNLTEAMKNLII